MTTRIFSASCAALFFCLPFFVEAAPPTAPQSTTGADQSDETLNLDKFVVTGSSIPTPETETFSPVTVYSLPEMAKLGASLPIEVLRHMPGFSGSVNTEQRTNGGTGGASVNLRGLAGTLSLLDGHRSAGFDNFNVLPTIAISRIEVVKDGASAFYGADALSGVFNVILIPKYTGAKFDIYYGNTTDKDAGVLRSAIMAGGTQGNTNVVVAFEYYRRNALFAADRAVSANSDGRSRGGKNQGSPTFSGRATARVGSNTAPVQDLVLKPGLSAGYNASDFVSFDPNTATSNQMLNFRQYTPTIPEQKHSNVYARLNHDLFGGRVEAFARVLFARDTFFNALAPAPIPTTGAAGTALRNAERASPHIPVDFFLGSSTDNAVSPGSTIVGTVPFRTIALGPRTQTYIRDVWDFNAGLRGRFGHDWTWNLDYIYSDLYRDFTQGGAPSLAKLSAHILDGSYNPWALDTAKGTNPNNGIAYDNPAALKDSQASGNAVQHYPTRGGDFNFSGTVWNLPGGDLKLGAGADYYMNNLTELPDAIFFTGDLLGLNASNPTISSSHGTGEFAELQIPVTNASMAIPALYSLSFSAAVRHDNLTVRGFANGSSGTLLSRDFKSNNPRFGIRWMPVEELMLRGTWGTGFRLPTLSQLYRAPGASQPALTDPLGFPIPRQTQITTQGNPALEPEKSTTYSAGLVYSPKQIQGLSLTVDYYSGEIKGLVGEGSQYILNVNAAGQGSGFVPGNPATINPNAPFANLITRAATGSVTTVNSTNFNISSRKTTGLDYAATYVWPLKSYGTFTTQLDWTTVLTWDLTPIPGSPSQSYVGLYLDTSNNAISPGSVPKQKGYVSQSWERGSWGAVFTAYYISRLKDDPAFVTVNNGIRYVKAWITCDAQVSYKIGPREGWQKWIDRTTIRVGVSNLFDEPAPFAAGAFNDSYDVTTHSNRGRFVYTQLTKEF